MNGLLANVGVATLSRPQPSKRYTLEATLNSLTNIASSFSLLDPEAVFSEPMPSVGNFVPRGWRHSLVPSPSEASAILSSIHCFERGTKYKKSHLWNEII